MKRTLIAALSVLTVAAVLPAWLHAQPPGSERIRERTRTFLVLRLSEHLDLDDETALKVSRIFRDSDQERRRLVAERRKLSDEIAGTLDKGVVEGLPGLIDRVEKIDRELMLLPTGSFEKIASLLTVEQRARLVLLRESLHREIRRTLHRRFGRQDRESREERRPPTENDPRRDLAP